MGNICSFGIKVVGEKDNVMKFFDAMEQKNGIYMGRGAEIYDIDITENHNNKSLISAKAFGLCKWSVLSSLINSAISMRTSPEDWTNGKDVISGKIKVLTLCEASKLYNVNVEIFSEECELCFAEHYVVLKGDLTTNEECEYREYYLDVFETKEEAEKKLGINITKENWEKGWFSTGGYDCIFSDLYDGFDVV